MIIYIINGKTKSVQEAIDYISDDSKTAKKSSRIGVEEADLVEACKNFDYEDFRTLMKDSINRTLDYVGNEEKTGRYISGYLCNPDMAELQFWLTKKINCSRVGESVEEDKGNYFYHIIQSFPEELDISDDEVHRCGIEFVQKLGLYQAVIASHVHPVSDEEGEAHGKCKHNHIVMNSHIYHKFVDPNNPRKMKYNDCKATYAQLQLINDQVAIEHGLPVIVNNKKYSHRSWYESQKIKEGGSWKQRVRADISSALRVSKNIEDYFDLMTAAGYKFQERTSDRYGEYITYTCPDGVTKVRDYKLGAAYTKPELEVYWKSMQAIREDNFENNVVDTSRIERVVDQASEPIFIKFEKTLFYNRKQKRREQNLNLRDTYTNYFPLFPRKRTIGKAELSYFKTKENYEIVNGKHQSIAKVSGAEILAYFSKQIQQAEKEEYYYTRPGYIDSITKAPYKVRMWDENGRKRTITELVLILAIVTIQGEKDRWNRKSKNGVKTQEYIRRPIYAHRDWKLQNMIDAVHIATEENIENPAKIDEHLNDVGKAIAMGKADVRRLTEAKNRMDVLKEALDGYDELKDICERIYRMPDGPEKVHLQQEYADELEEYKSHKAVMYRHEVTSKEDIESFLERYEEMNKKISVAHARVDVLKNRYRRLSKLKYHIQLAENKLYCYGPEYEDPEAQQTTKQVKQREEPER